MLILSCGRDVVSLGIRSKEGAWIVTAFLDNLVSCNECSQSEGALIGLLNDLILFLRFPSGLSPSLTIDPLIPGTKASLETMA